MGLYHVIALDKPGALDLRLANRAAHLDWAKANPDIVKLAGPVFAEDGETFAGSVFVVDAESHEAVLAWQAGDPYVKAGLFCSVDIRPFKWVIGAPA